MNQSGRQDPSSISIAIIAGLIEVGIGVLSNLLASGIEIYLPVANLGLLIFIGISIPLLIVVRVLFEHSAKRKGSPVQHFKLRDKQFRKRLMLAWGQLVYWLGIMTTIGIIVYLVSTHTYPERIDLRSFSCWGMSFLWLSSLMPWSLGLNYRARVRVLADWPTWLKKIGTALNSRDELSQLEIGNLMGADATEAREAMMLFAKETLAVIGKDTKDHLVLKRQPNIQEPLQKPDTPSAIPSAKTPVHRSPDFNLDLFKKLFTFASGMSGLRMNKDDANSWAESNLEFFEEHDFRRFQEIALFARSLTGLNMQGIDAAQWAKENLGYFSVHDFRKFQESFHYAHSVTGLNKTTSEAIEWAFEKMGK